MHDDSERLHKEHEQEMSGNVKREERARRIAAREHELAEKERRLADEQRAKAARETDDAPGDE